MIIQFSIWLRLGPDLMPQCRAVQGSLTLIVNDALSDGSLILVSEHKRFGRRFFPAIAVEMECQPDSSGDSVFCIWISMVNANVSMLHFGWVCSARHFSMIFELRLLSTHSTQSFSRRDAVKWSRRVALVSLSIEHDRGSTESPLDSLRDSPEVQY